MSNESPVVILENLIKFIDINSERLSEGKSTLCRTDKGETIRDNLPCSVKNDAGEYKIKCEDCPFSSVEAGEETKLELLEIIEKEKVKDLLLQRT